MKVMPFLVASGHSVEWATPLLSCHGEVIQPGQTFQTWDYLSPLSVHLGFTMNAELLAAGVLGRPVGVAETAGVLACSTFVLQVECPSTQYRQLVECAPSLEESQDSLTLIIPAGEVANEITLTSVVVLKTHSGGWGSLAPAEIGSRLITDEGRWTVTLEGKGSAFPVSAFSFAGTGYPENALWYLNMHADRLADPFVSVVRLLVNSAHPRSNSLLSGHVGGGVDDLPEVLHYDLLATMLETASTLPEGDLRVDFDEGSAGYVLNQLSDVYLGQNLADLAGRIAHDLPAFRGELQSSLGFMTRVRAQEED